MEKLDEIPYFQNFQLIDKMCSLMRMRNSDRFSVRDLELVLDLAYKMPVVRARSRNELFRQFRHQERPFTSTISHRRYSRRPTLWRRAKPTSSEWLSFDETSRNSNLFTAIWKICRIVSMELCVC